ncbi:hypothetical protein EDD11_007830 [Mortierella claussenii]|nr:hypothetical protein EDD11_007830 [Mortierella claussenii]
MSSESGVVGSTAFQSSSLRNSTTPDSSEPLSSPVSIRSSQLPRNAVGAGGRGRGSGSEGAGVLIGAQNISFSPLPAGKSFSELHPTRRMHETSTSPAQSFVQVLESADMTGDQGHAERGNISSADQDVASSYDRWAPGASGVFFQPQGSHHHNQRGRTGSGVGSAAWLGTSMPESRFSEFEVVYDDGVRKQRTFSLTTELDDDHYVTSSGDDDDNSGSEDDPLLEFQEADPFQNHQPGYAGNAAMLSSPMMGKYGSIHPPSGLFNRQQHPASPGSNRNPLTCLYGGIVAGWLSFTNFKLSLPNRRIFKASLAYLLACLLSFTPFFLPYIGASGHLAASAAVFFNPAKSLGRMVDAVTAGLSAIGFGFLVSVASSASAVWFNNRDMYIWGHVVSVVVFGGGSTFIIAYAKAYYNPCTLSHIMILVTLTKEGALSLVDFNLARVLASATAMLLGVVISTVISVVLWPESAHEKLRQDMGKSLSSFRLLLKLLTKTFLLEADTTPFGSESVQKMIESQVKSFSALAKSLEEAQLEFPGSDIKKYEACVKSLNTLAQYLNGLRSSCGLQYDMMKKDEQRKDSETHRQSGLPTSAPSGATGGGRRVLGMGMRMSSFSLIGSLNSEQDQSASAELIDFLDHVGKPMKSLALTCKLTIEHLQDIFTSTNIDRLPVTKRPYSQSAASHSHLRQSGYDSAEAFSDAPCDIGTTRTENEHYKKKPSLDSMQHNLAKALDIFEAANSKALKRFYSHQHKRRSGMFKRPGMTKRMSEPSIQDLASKLAGVTTGAPTRTTPQASSAATEVSDRAPVGEQIFLVYFFVFNLMEFSKELSHLVSCVDILVDGDYGLPLWIARNRQSWWRRIWFYLTGFPRRLRRPRSSIIDHEDDSESGGLPTSNSSHGHLTFASTAQSSVDQQQQSSYSTAASFRKRRKQRLFPKPNIHNKANTLQTPTPSTFSQKWSTRLWKFLHIFRSFQVKYAAKAAISTMILLIPAFVDWTRPYFVQYRGEWALISMLIVMVPTVGGTNIVGIYRIMGTIAGCYMGVAIYLLFPAHEIMLPLCCFLFAIPNFYLVLCSSYPRIGQVTLLAFNLVLIQTYNRRHGDGTVPPDDDDDDENMANFFAPFSVARGVGLPMKEPPNDPSHIDVVWTIALHRAVAVSIGVVIGVLVTSYIWPYEARVELRKGLSDLLLNISWLYNRLVSVYSTNLDRIHIIPAEEPHQKGRSKFQDLLRKSTFQERFQTPGQEEETTLGESSQMHIERMNKEFMAIELSLQLQLLQLYALLEETPNEPRLKGKFPVGTYKNMLGSCQNILDRFLSMRLVITKDEWVESARRDFIVPVNKERREMVGNVLLYFYTIASALRLKTPLPPYLPPANNARLRLIQKIRQLPVVQNKVVMTEELDERYIFYYAYALVMDDIIRELERLGQWSQDLFGVITPAAEFESWFTNDGMAPLEMSSPQMPSSATREAPLSPYHDVEQPYQYPTLKQTQLFSQSLDQPMQQDAPSTAVGRRHPDEASEFQASEARSSYHSAQISVNERDGMFDFDSHDPFRDQTAMEQSEGLDAGARGRLEVPSSLQSLAFSQRTGHRDKSSHSLNAVASRSSAQRRHGSEGYYKSQESRSQNLQSDRRYEIVSRNFGNFGGSGAAPRQKKLSASSSRSSLSGSEVGTGIGAGAVLPSNTSRPERPLTTSISATRLAGEANFLGQHLVQEPQSLQPAQQQQQQQQQQQ